MSHLFGVDGGGTGCRAALADSSGKVLANGKSGPANIMTNLEGARDNMLAACVDAIEKSGLKNLKLEDCDALLGLAGANISDYGLRLIAMLPFRNCHIETDAVVSLEGAVGSRDGAAAIIGTGSVFIYRKDGITHTIGGWGFMVGDLGSGSRLGRALLQEALLVFDGVHEGSPLTMTVLSKFENDPQTIVEYSHTAMPGEFGTFAPLVFDYAEKNDPIAKRVLAKGVADIEETIDVILARGVENICLLGGLGIRYEALLCERLRSHLTQPLGDAVDGAIALAVKHFATGKIIQ